jgi:hypothetical protein
MTEVVKNLGGRPVLKTDWDLLHKVLSRGGRMADCVYFTGLSASTIERRIRDEHDMTFNDYRELHLSQTRAKILDKQIEVALEGDPTMLKHLGEHLCGQITKTQNLNVNTSVEDYLRRLDKELNAG